MNPNLKSFLYMNSDLSILIPLAASVGFVHTLFGPDHYVPFIVMAKARGWSWIKTSLITIGCGIGHVGSSIAIGALGIAFGIGVNRLEDMEAVRGNWAAWSMLLFGLGYFGWGIWKGYRNKPHNHIHLHDGGQVHIHSHDHEHAVTRVLVQQPVQGPVNPGKLHFERKHEHNHDKKETVNLTPWILFLIFVLGPCEPLIPVFIYPAAQHSISGVIWVSVIFSLVTILTMLSMVFLGLFGIKQLPFARFDRWMHAIAGAIIALSGAGIIFLGL
jgi:nickel/cobalt transporter (NicO) family protein